MQVPDLQLREFKGWRQKALDDHHHSTDHQSVRLRIDSLNLSQITPEEDVKPEPEIYEESWRPEECEVFYMQMKKELGIRAGKVQRDEDQAVSNVGTLTFLKNWWEVNGILLPNIPPPQKWKELSFWFRLDKRTSMGKVFERIMVYITGNGDNSRQPYVRLGKTFYIKGGSDHVRQRHRKLFYSTVVSKSNF
jgi:hypothetical protein